MNDVIYGALAIPYKVSQNECKFLLLKHQKGFWTFPGGGKEAEDKTLLDTLIRELKEEIGLTINKDSVTNTRLANYFVYDDNKPERAGKKGITRFYLLKLSGMEVLGSWDKISEHGWFNKEEITKLLPYEDERRIFLEATKLL